LLKSAANGGVTGVAGDRARESQT